MRLSQIENCAMCGKGLMHDGAITCYEVSITQQVFDIRELQRVHGMEQFFGASPANPHAVGVARVFTGDPEVAKPLPTERAFICQSCLLLRGEPVAIVKESLARATERREAAHAAKNKPTEVAA